MTARHPDQAFRFHTVKPVTVTPAADSFAAAKPVAPARPASRPEPAAQSEDAMRAARRYAEAITAEQAKAEKAGESITVMEAARRIRT